MRSIFVCKSQDSVKRVYDECEIDFLKENAGLCTTVFNKNDILANEKIFKDTEFIFSTWGMEEFTSEEIKEIFPLLKCVFYAAGTVKYFAKPFLDANVKIVSAFAANAVPVAEFTVALITLLNKGFFASSLLASHGNYQSAKKLSENYCGNYGATVGIIGVGAIGTMVAQRLKSFDINVIAFDPFLPDEKADKLGITKVSLKEIFEKSDIITNHLANNEQTVNLLNYDLFSLMKKNASFINTGRGAQVVEKDLVRILYERKDITAVLDVNNEEGETENIPFYNIPNCVLTPHIAGSSGYEVHRMARYMREEFNRFLNGKELKYEVTSEMLKTMA